MPLLVPLETGDSATLEEIISCKMQPRQTRLQTLRPRILRRYRSYADRVPDLADLPSSRLTARQSADCEHCYDQGTRALGLLRQRIIDILPDPYRQLCALCKIGPWATVDHFVPKSRFPEFSIFGRNLIPCCDECNRLKGEAWIRNGAPVVLNLYYDDWHARRYLRVDIDYDEDRGASIQFQLVNHPRHRYLTSRLATHHKRLKLLERFNAAGAAAVGEYQYTMSSHGVTAKSRARRYLREEAEGLTALYGINYWKAVLAETLADLR